MRITLAAGALAIALALTACGDDDSSATTTPAPSTAASTTRASSTAAAPSTTATSVAPTSAAPTTSTPTTQPTTAAPTTVDVGTIVVDADNDPLRTVSVPLGTAVTLTVRSAMAQEFHLHGYDLELSGTEVVFQFTADLPGSFELESHDSEGPIVVLQVG
jgi:hypothetical protein